MAFDRRDLERALLYGQLAAAMGDSDDTRAAVDVALSVFEPYLAAQDRVRALAAELGSAVDQAGCPHPYFRYVAARLNAALDGTEADRD